MGKFVIAKGGGDALVIIDPQNDFVRKKGALYVAGVPEDPTDDEAIRNVVRLANRSFDIRVVSYDHHPKDKHVEYDIFGGKHCVEGATGAKAVDEVREGTRRKYPWFHIIKGSDPSVISYSIVVSPDFGKFIGVLRERGIKRVLVAGWAYTHCVGESAIAIASQGFETFVVRDATRSVPPPYGDPEKMDQKLALYGVKLIRMRDVRTR